MTNGEVKNILLNNIQPKYKSGKFWNHDSTKANDPTSTTDSPCTHHGDICKKYDGTCGCNFFGKGIQCHGFALHIANLTFGSYPDVNTNPSVSNGVTKGDWLLFTGNHCDGLILEPGDIVRAGGHSAIVYDANGSTFSVAEVWGNPKNAAYNCRINWDKFSGDITTNNHETMMTFIKSDQNNFICKAPKELSISYNLNGGAWTRDNSDSLAMNLGTVTLTGAKPAREGYVFEGWECSVDGNVYTENANISGLWNLDSMTLTARWVPNFITVTFNASNGLPVGVT